MIDPLIAAWRSALLVSSLLIFRLLLGRDRPTALHR